jgi:hypothetical protein
MSTVVFDISMSLDGFMTASNRSPEVPMGDGGLKLVEWAMGDDERGRAFLERSISGLARPSPAGTPTTTRCPGGGPTGLRVRRAGLCSSLRTRRRPRAPKAASTRS